MTTFQAVSPHTTRPQTVHATIDELAAILGERKRSTKTQLLIVYASLGHATCKRLLDQTCAMERDGGMLTKDGTRRRTMGGVFIQLAREEMPPAAWSAIRRIVRQQTNGGAQ